MSVPAVPTLTNRSWIIDKNSKHGRYFRIVFSPPTDADGWRITRNNADVELATRDLGTHMMCSDYDCYPWRENVYRIYAYNTDGESDALVVTSSVTPVMEYLVPDRTAADVAARSYKGTYNDVDLNRVADALAYIRGMLDEYGYSVPDEIKNDWQVNDIPTVGGMNEHIQAIRGLDVIRYSFDPVKLPTTLRKLGYQSANDIERFLLEIGRAAERIPQSYIYCGEIYGGEF